MLMTRLGKARNTGKRICGCASWRNERIFIIMAKLKARIYMLGADTTQNASLHEMIKKKKKMVV